VRATSPSGAAAYEGRVLWSGDLGYGVRPPERGQSETPEMEPPEDVREPWGQPGGHTDAPARDFEGSEGAEH
jgi:NADH-quinone oxidoreductase subunit I